jgi:CRP/FNR family transcriptional regulator, cyclic AMP receptor protein
MSVGKVLHEPMLTSRERHAINTGRWFEGLSPGLRHDVLRCAYVRHFRHGQHMSSRGEPASEWIACASGTVRVRSFSPGGQELTLAYIGPGVWFGDIALVDGDALTHDTSAEGDTTILCVSRLDFHQILEQHAELSRALLNLNVRRLRNLYKQLEDAITLPLRTRLGKQLLILARSHGVPVDEHERQIRIALSLPQDELAHLLGASRQRVNGFLKEMERASLIQLGQSGIVINDTEALRSHLDQTALSTARGRKLATSAPFPGLAAKEERAHWVPK